MQKVIFVNNEKQLFCNHGKQCSSHKEVDTLPQLVGRWNQSLLARLLKLPTDMRNQR